MNQHYSKFIVNLFSLSLQQYLYFWKVYPEACFEPRTLSSLTLHSVKACILSEYLDRLNALLLDLVPILDAVEIEILEGGEVMSRMVLIISVPKDTVKEDLCRFDSEI